MADKGNKNSLRPPIVVILGHVDHGKTTLLDFLRKSKVQEKEAGGITQSIGASVVKTKEGKKITFIDTPGHAAFSNMRSRGAKIADIAVLIVAANDGVKPQTKEALEYILQNNIPFIVASNKMDLPNVKVETVYSSLEAESVSFEGRGGDTPLIPISAKTGDGVDDLLETISLMAELYEIKGDAKANLEAVVIETRKEKSGPSASVVVRNGTLKVGDEIVTENTDSRVRAIFDYNGQSIKDVGPGEACKIIGFSELPHIGSSVWKKSEKESLPVKNEEKQIQPKMADDQLPVIIKADNAGSLEAILANLPEEVFVISKGVGNVTETDVFMAKSAHKKPYIFVFESDVSQSIKKMAETEGIEIRKYDVIYKLFEDIEKIIKQGQTKILGMAEILDVFPYNKRKVAGCKIVSGQISKDYPVILLQGEKEVGEAKILSIRKRKDEIETAKQGEECGILFTPQFDFEEGDVLLSIRK